MKVRILQSIASPTFSYRMNEVTELDDELAAAWMSSGICEAVPEQAGAETAPLKKPRKK
jgi:hypothetical protein